jgi:hypothetical protein
MLASKLSFFVIFAAASGAASPALHFDLTRIAPTDLYSGETGYGYEKVATGNPPITFRCAFPKSFRAD